MIQITADRNNNISMVIRYYTEEIIFRQNKNFSFLQISLYSPLDRSQFK